MRFGGKSTEWRPWFAWRPVRTTESLQRIWFETVMYRYNVVGAIEYEAPDFIMRKRLLAEKEEQERQRLAAQQQATYVMASGDFRDNYKKLLAEDIGKLTDKAIYEAFHGVRSSGPKRSK